MKKPIFEGLIARGAGKPILNDLPPGKNGTIAITVRLDPDRYARLKAFSRESRRSNQQHMVDALDAYLRLNGR